MQIAISVGRMEQIDAKFKNLLPISVTLLAIFLANATAKTAVIQTVAAKVFARSK